MTLKNSSEMLEVTNRACDCVGRNNEVQAGLAEQARKVLLLLSFCASPSRGVGWAGRSSGGRPGIRARGAKAGPFARAPGTRALRVYRGAILLSVSDGPSAYF